MRVNVKVTTPWEQDVSWTYIRRSEDFLDVFWTSYVRSVYLLCPVWWNSSQLSITCWKAITETLENVWHMFKVNNKNTRTTSITSLWCFFWLALNIYHTFFECFYRWRWTSKYQLGSYLLKNSLMEKFIFCAIIFVSIRRLTVKYEVHWWNISVFFCVLCMWCYLNIIKRTPYDISLRHCEK